MPSPFFQRNWNWFSWGHLKGEPDFLGHLWDLITMFLLDPNSEYVCGHVCTSYHLRTYNNRDSIGHRSTVFCFQKSSEAR